MDDAGTGAGETVRLRAMDAADLSRIAQLEVELFGRGAWSTAMLAEELTAPDRWYLVAEVDGAVAGYAGLWFDGETAQVMTIGVAASAQRRGVGRLLLGAMVERAVWLGAGAVLLEVRTDNRPALRLYESAGFTVLGLRRGYYQAENADAFTMRLPLGSAPPAAVEPGERG